MLTFFIALLKGGFGGPLFLGTAPNEVLIGIASWGMNPCGTIGAPSGVFTRVEAYVDWIRSATGIV